jgi:hypothetical protein
MLELKTEALLLAQQIPNSVLYKMHKKLPEIYAKYKAGLTLRINNLKNGNAQDEVKGSILIDEWANWLEKNRKDIKVPKWTCKRCV